MSPAAGRRAITTVIFDFGGVVVDWDMRHLFRTVFDDADEMERFLAEVLTPEENLRLDLGTPLADIVADLAHRHPADRAALEAWRDRWIETIPREVPGADELLRELRHDGYRLIGLSNFSNETFPLCRARYRVFDHFDDIVLSGDVGLAKPDPSMYRLACSRSSIGPDEAVFIDDSPRNVAGAEAVDIHALLFRGIDELRRDLRELGVPIAS